MSENTNAHDIITTAVAAAKPSEVTEGGLYSVIVPQGGQHQLIDLDLDKYRERPRRKKGTVTVHDAASFVAYIAKHGLSETEIWADVTRSSLIGIINANMGTTGDGVEDYAGWSDHRAVLQVRPTHAWNAWAALDGKFLAQSAFAEHIENRVIDIVTPSGADMLEVAQSISATIGVTFESSKQLSNGERQLEYRQNIDAKAGARGRLDIPTSIELALVPFEGAPAYKVKARFRYRINDGQLLLCYALERPEDVVANAFADIVAAVEDGLIQPIFRGIPSN